MSNNVSDILGKMKMFMQGNYEMKKYYILHRLFGKTSTHQNDDFNWALYNIHYRGEVKNISKAHTMYLRKDDYVFDNDKLTKHDKSIKPLHQNWRLLYETILQLDANSVFEMGVGNGMHLKNLSTLSPGIELSGIDRSEEQLNFMKECFPDLQANVKQYDATKQFPPDLFKQVDVSYTQAVIMHINTDQLHVNALRNLFNISKKHVLLVENWTRHDFMSEIKELFNSKQIGWEQIYFYYRICEETKNPHMMICSKTPLDYPVLDDYRLLLDPLVG